MLLLNKCQYYDARMWAKFEETGLEEDALLGGGAALWGELGVSARCVDIMSRALSSGWIDRELDACDKIGVRIITCRDATYPAELSELADAPAMLYVRGSRLSPPPETVGIVGTRRCSSYGAKTAREIGRRAAANGWSIISGGAKGIDSAAHEGCLEGGGFTAAVLGCGVDVVYPPENKKLFERIRESGALFSEYPLGSGSDGWRFPRRNRIIAGLSSRLVVAEAQSKSGAMITARQAAEAGRDVWSVPGRIDDARCAGSNRLIFDGAIPFIDNDTFFGVAEPQKKLFDDAAAEPRREAVLNDAEKTLVALLTNNGDRTIDNMANEAKMNAAEVFRYISMLSLKGVVCLSGPGRYRLAD
jgi:DNA processing protein